MNTWQNVRLTKEKLYSDSVLESLFQVFDNDHYYSLVQPHIEPPESRLQSRTTQSCERRSLNSNLNLNLQNNASLNVDTNHWAICGSLYHVQARQPV